MRASVKDKVMTGREPWDSFDSMTCGAHPSSFQLPPGRVQQSHPPDGLVCLRLPALDLTSSSERRVVVTLDSSV